LEFSTVEESEQGSSATDSLSEDVTDGWMEERRRKKEESFLKLAMPNAFRPNYQFPMTNNQFPKQIGGALRPPLLIN
jgi:hypothetical protein